MSEAFHDSDLSAEPGHHALIDLHARAGTFEGLDPGELPGFHPSTFKDALKVVADAPPEEVPLSARIDILHALAKADFPEYDSTEKQYLQLAQSVAGPNQLSAEDLLSDLKTSAQSHLSFASTTSGQQLPHHLTAFIGENICKTGPVDVSGLRGTWIFSEFETDAPFENVADWVDPHNWPTRGPMLFKQMSLVGGPNPVNIGTLGSEHWHGLFHEEVQLVTRVNTLLHCDFWRDGNESAGMTYELNLSLDGEIDVDRGFLLVNDAGPVRRVKALKIVGFSARIWDQVAATVCPFWTDFVRSAVEGGSSSTPGRPTETSPGTPADIGDNPLGEMFEAWVEFFGDSARAYLELFGGNASRAVSPGYKVADFVDDGQKVWSQLAKDWAKAWSFGFELLDEIADQGINAGIMPPGKPSAAARGSVTSMTAAPAGGGPGAESTLIPVKGIGAGDVVRCTDLMSIEAGGRYVAANDLTVAVEQLPDGSYGVRISTNLTSIVPGLYVGELKGANGNTISPAQLFISGVVRANRG